MLAITMVYGDIGGFERFWVVKNKAKQSPFARLWPGIRNRMNGCGMADEKSGFLIISQGK